MQGVSVLLAVGTAGAGQWLAGLIDEFDTLEVAPEVAVVPNADSEQPSLDAFDLILIDVEDVDTPVIDALRRTKPDVPCVMLASSNTARGDASASIGTVCEVIGKQGLTSKTLEKGIAGALIGCPTRNQDQIAWDALRTMGSMAADAFCLLDARSYSIVYWNSQFDRLTGLNGASAPLPISDLGASGKLGETGHIIAKACLAALRCGSSISTYAALYDGTKLRINSELLRDMRGQPAGAVCRFDVLERPEDALGRHTGGERLFRQMAEAAPNVVWLMSAEGKCLYVNKRWQEITGQTPQQALGYGWMEHVHPDDLGVCREAITHASQERTPCVTEWRLRGDDGELRWLFCTGNPRYDDDGRFAGFVGSCRDVTEDRRAKALMHEADKLAATGRMAVRIAHEINNPLAGIKNSFLLIKDAISENHPYYAYVARIERELARIADVVRQMYELYKPAKIPPGDCDVSRAIDDVCGLVHAKSVERNVEIKAEKPSGKLTVPGANEGMLRQVLFNVVANAIEASPSGSVVELSARMDDGGIEIAIADAGPGINDDVKERIFEPFFTTKTTMDGAGLGLGLATSKSLVDVMGGRLEFRSLSGGGTVFYIFFPSAPGVEGNDQ